MLRATWWSYALDFVFEARTSRAVMHHKHTYFVRVWDDARPEVSAMGECALFHGLSREDDNAYEQRLTKACNDPLAAVNVSDSSIRIGFQGAIADLTRKSDPNYIPTAWETGEVGIPINGLVWMGDKATMLQRIQQKLDDGFRCIKIKIGGIDFEDELDLLRHIRSHFSSDVLELRLDANGAFNVDNALVKIDRLSQFNIHSLEQPVMAGQYDLMADICAKSPIPIALDEELIGTTSDTFKQQLLSFVKPHYIIVKPSLCGGFADADKWIATANDNGIGWWATSALESNVGLHEIAVWLSRKSISMPQGLGTGQLYSNNIGHAHQIVGDKLFNVRI